MTKVQWADAIARAMEKVPIPMVSTVAAATDTILSAIEADRQINLAAERSFLQQVAAAENPWQHVNDVATGKV